jgi:hypothetical protein
VHGRLFYHLTVCFWQKSRWRGANDGVGVRSGRLHDMLGRKK